MRQFKVNDELINKVKRLISNDDKDKLIMSLENFTMPILLKFLNHLKLTK